MKIIIQIILISIFLTSCFGGRDSDSSTIGEEARSSNEREGAENTSSDKDQSDDNAEQVITTCDEGLAPKTDEEWSQYPSECRKIYKKKLFSILD